MITQASVQQIVTEILSSGVMTAGQQAGLLHLLEDGHCTGGDIEFIDRLAHAIGEGRIQLPRLESP